MSTGGEPFATMRSRERNPPGGAGFARVSHACPSCCVRSWFMAPRAYWKGYLKLSLVSCPIALYPASSSSERVSFNRINNKTGNRLKQQNVDSVTGDPVEKDDVWRGYEVAKRQCIQVA